MSSRRFYRLLADRTASTRWHLKSPLDPSGSEVDPRSFTQGGPVGPQPPLTLPIRREGREVDFNFCDFDMVVTPAVVNAELEELVGPAIQRIAVTVDGRADEFEILNVCGLVRCVDETRSLLTMWTDADERPEKVGQFRTIVKLKIFAAAADRHHIFRIAGWPIALIASEEVKGLLEDSGVSGVKYDRVD